MGGNRENAPWQNGQRNQESLELLYEKEDREVPAIKEWRF